MGPVLSESRTIADSRFRGRIKRGSLISTWRNSNEINAVRPRPQSHRANPSATRIQLAPGAQATAARYPEPSSFSRLYDVSGGTFDAIDRFGRVTTSPLDQGPSIRPAIE
jgi:hypothetical protein